MPFKIVKKGGRYQVVNMLTGKVHAKGTTKRKAEAQIRIMNKAEGI